LGGGDISGKAAGELGLLLEVQPDSAATGDATARAATGQLVQESLAGAVDKTRRAGGLGAVVGAVVAPAVRDASRRRRSAVA
jgi:hypothetical protein